MKYVYQYHTHNEREEIVNTHSDKYLIEERNIKDGNFLVFSDEPIPERVIYTQVPKDEIETSKQRITDLELTIADTMTL